MALIKIAGLWKNEKDGVSYYSGYLGDGKILIFENKNRDPSKQHPTHEMFICEKDQARREKTVENYRKKEASYDNSAGIGASVSFDDDDIPF